jgi:hypothetical protein
MTTSTVVAFPAASITVSLEKPLPSGTHLAVRRRKTLSSGLPLAIQRNGDLPPCSFRMSGR